MGPPPDIPPMPESWESLFAHADAVDVAERDVTEALAEVRDE